MSLPIHELVGTLPWGPRVVLGAPTGTGKSTQVPLWLATEGRVLVVEPRRVACRSLCRYLSQSTPDVGYAVRYEREGPENPRILYVTTGVALRLAARGQLSDFSSILLDEFHERTLEQDLLLALLPRLAPESRWVLMSATLDLDRLAAFVGGEKLVATARSHEVTLSYLGGSTLPSRENLATRVRAAVGQALRETSGNVLVFLPGMGEIQECRAALKERDVDVLVLHGRLTSAEQDRAFDATGRRRVVLATNVAETSVTLPGITAVVDSGLVRQKIHRKGFSALSTEAVSQSSADQRKGRAGRLGPGICLRLWHQDGRLEATTAPEVSRLELTDLAMNAAVCHQDVFTLNFVDPPPEFALRAAVDSLERWGLLPPKGDALELPLPVALARLVPLAPPDVLPDWVDVCALLESRGSLFDPRAPEAAIEQRGVDFPGCRLLSSLRALRAGDVLRHGLQAEVLGQARESASRLRAELGLGPLGGTVRLEALAIFLARHWPERVFVKRPKRDVFANGQSEARVDGSEGLPDDCRAAILLEVQPLSQRGLQVQLKARWALPCSLAALRAAGVGDTLLDAVKWSGQRVVGELVRQVAGIELSRDTAELAGSHLRDGLCQLLTRGSLWREAMLQLENDHRLAALDGSGAPPWKDALLARLLTLGVESPEDVELIGPADLVTAPLDEATRARLNAQFPAIFSTGVAVYTVAYDPAARTVLLTWKSGTRNVPVPLALVPRWNGWMVQLDERGRLTRVR